jgi:biopolymer transport protein ExbB
MTAEKNKGKFNSLFAIAVIPVILIISYIFYKLVLGDPTNFIENNVENNPKPGNYMGMVYKGGIIVPILMSFFLMVITFSIERFLTIFRASGTGSIGEFVRIIKNRLALNDLTGALDACDVQKGSIGNVTRSVLEKYRQVDGLKDMTREQKAAALQKELEEATSLELPMLEKNLTIIATLASIATLVGLLGTVIGMIKAFAALATAGNPDAVALANGISEALINTALGIASSTFAIISYNYFTSQIDTLTYGMDEIGFTIVQTMNSKSTSKESPASAVLN